MVERRDMGNKEILVDMDQTRFADLYEKYQSVEEIAGKHPRADVRIECDGGIVIRRNGCDSNVIMGSAEEVDNMRTGSEIKTLENGLPESSLFIENLPPNLRHFHRVVSQLGGKLDSIGPKGRTIVVWAANKLMGRAVAEETAVERRKAQKPIDKGGGK